MNKEFLFNLLFLIGINLIIKPFYVFGIDLQVQNIVGKNAYGLYFALFNFSYIFQVLTDLGIQQYNNRNIAQHEHLLDKYFSSILLLKGGLSILFFGVSILAALAIGYSGFSLHLLVFLLLNQIFITLTFFFRSNISGLQHYRLDSILSTTDKVLMILFCLPLVYGNIWELKIQYFIYAQSLALGLTALISFVMVYRFLAAPLRFRWKNSLFKAILKKSTPFALVVLLMTIYARVDAVMLERLLPQTGAAEAGVYAAGYRLLDAINMICFLFAGLLLPMFSRMLKQQKSVVDLLGLSTRIMLVITLSFSIAVAFQAINIVQLLYPTDGDSYMASVLVLLMIGFNAIGIIHIIGTLLTANGSLRSMNIVFVVGILVNIVTNYILIPIYGAWGAALTTVFTQSFVAMAELWLVVRIFQLSVNYKLIGQVFIFVVGLLCTNYILVQWSAWWIIQFVLAGIFALLWSLIVGVINIKKILALKPNK